MLSWVDIVNVWGRECDFPVVIDEEIGGHPLEHIGYEPGVAARSFLGGGKGGRSREFSECASVDYVE